MKKVCTVAAVAMCGCWVYVHRRLIDRLVTGEELPEAPEWHVWCKNRKGN